MAENGDIPKSVKFISALWPVALAAAAILISSVRSDAQLQSTADRVDYLFSNGSPRVVERLGRIEERQDVLIQAVNRIEGKLDGRTSPPNGR